MLIRIIYSDGRFDMVKSFFLDWLIESRRIVGFQRSDGWAVLGRDPIRTHRSGFYPWPERRAELKPPPIALLALRLKQEEWSKGEQIKKEPKESAQWDGGRCRLHGTCDQDQRKA